MSLHQSNDEKKPTAEPATIPSPCSQVERYATDLAVSSTPSSEAPLTRSYLGPPPPPVNSTLQFYENASKREVKSLIIRGLASRIGAA